MLSKVSTGFHIHSSAYKVSIGSTYSPAFGKISPKNHPEDRKCMELKLPQMVRDTSRQLDAETEAEILLAPQKV